MAVQARLDALLVRKHRCLLYIGIVLLVIGTTLQIFFPSMLNALIRHQLKFYNGSNVYNNWKVNKEPYNHDFYFYNWTNPEDIYDTNIKPKFQQLGPYRYHLFIEKLNVTVHDNGTATYMLAKKYIFVQEEGTRPVTDLITTINPIPNIMAYKFRNWNIFAKFGVSLAFRSINAKLYITKTVDELLFKGFHDPILDALANVPLASSALIDKFGYFYKKNYTDFLSGPVNFHTTVDDDYGQLITYENANKTKYFSGDCGTVRGSSGEFTEMNRDTNKKMDIFVPEINSFLTVNFEKQQDIKGIIGNRYSPSIVFDNGTKVPEEKCFCNGECVPSGLRNVSSSCMDAPIFLSLPHFYKADPYYNNAIEGLVPEPENDDVFVVYEPISGVVTAVGLKIQLNMLLQPIKGIGAYSDVPKYFIPVFYLNQTVVLEDGPISELFPIQIAPVVVHYASIMFICAAVLLIINAILSKMLKYKLLKPKKIADNINYFSEEEDPLNITNKK